MTGSEQPFRRHAEAHEERARAGLDPAIATARPFDADGTAAPDRTPLARKLGPVPELRIPCVDVARHESAPSPFRQCAPTVVDSRAEPSTPSHEADARAHRCPAARRSLLEPSAARRSFTRNHCATRPFRPRHIFYVP